MTPLLKLDRAKKYFPIERGILRRTVGWIKAVDDVNLSIAGGEVFGLVGESGCGKTTLGKLAIGLLEPTRGKVYFEEKDLSQLTGEEYKKVRRLLQIVFQDLESSLNPRFRVRDTLEEALKAGGQDATQTQIVELLYKVGLSEEHIDRFPHELSGGQKQRVGIARSLALRPKFIVADEPVSALDVSIRAQILNLLVDLQKEFGLTYMFISHDLSVVRYTSDRIGVMYLGKLVEVAQPEELFNNPLHPYTQALVSAILDPLIHPSRTRVVLRGEVPSAANPPRGCRFHTRCPYAMQTCVEVEPQLVEIRPRHYTACHLYD